MSTLQVFNDSTDPSEHSPWSVHPDWQPVVSEDELANYQIEAYKRGRADEREALEKVVADLVNHQLERSGELAYKILGELASHHIPYYHVKMRMVSLYKLELMILVDEQSFATSQFLEVYQTTAILEAAYQEPDLWITLSYLPTTINSWNNTALTADGYFFTLNLR